MKQIWKWIQFIFPGVFTNIKTNFNRMVKNLAVSRGSSRVEKGEFLPEVKKWQAIPEIILTVDPPTRKDSILCLTEDLAALSATACATAEKLVAAKRQREETVSALLQSEQDIDALLNSKVAKLTELIQQNKGGRSPE